MYVYTCIHIYVYTIQWREPHVNAAVSACPIPIITPPPTHTLTHLPSPYKLYIYTHKLPQLFAAAKYRLPALSDIAHAPPTAELQPIPSSAAADAAAAAAGAGAAGAGAGGGHGGNGNGDGVLEGGRQVSFGWRGSAVFGWRGSAGRSV